MGGDAVKNSRTAFAPYNPAIDIAFVCTGNICRSPMAEVMMRAHLEEVAPELTVGSAGLMFDGRPAEPNAVRAMEKRGLDLSEHRARKISAEMFRHTSLILGMERVHVRKVALMGHALFYRSFTLREFAHLAGIVGARPDDESLRDWAQRIGRLRSVDDYGHEDRSSSILDPMGGTVRAFRECADTIDRSLLAVVALAWPADHPSDTPVAPATSGGIHADRDRR